MKSTNTYYTNKKDLNQFLLDNKIDDNPNLLIQVFTGTIQKQFIKNLLLELNSLLPNSALIGSTTDGEIMNGMVSTKKTVLSFTLFEHTTLQTHINMHKENGYFSGKDIAKNLILQDTKLLIAFANGVNTNGEAFLNGIDSINKDVVVAGGLAGDNANFEKTYIFDKNTIYSKGAVAVALNSKTLEVQSLYNFNWNTIGNKLIVTKAIGNRLYAINHRTAYETYVHYLGENTAIQLPKIGIEFPLIINRNGVNIARAVTAKHKDGSLSFAGNLNEGDEVMFGHGDVEAILSESDILTNKIRANPAEVLFVYSCMARRHFLEKEIEHETLPLNDIAPTAGFFTYGEFFSSKKKELLNQTMTVITLRENNINKCSIPQKDHAYHHKADTSKNALIHLIEVTQNEIKNQEKLTKEREVFKMMFEKSADGIIILEDNKIQQCNQKMLKMLKYSDKESLLKLNYQDIYPEFQDNNKQSSEIINKNINLCLEDGEQNDELKCLKADGELFWCEIILIPIQLEGGEVIKAVFRDISKRKEIEIQVLDQKDILYYQARHDILTGLPNRTLFQERFREDIKNMKKLTLMFIDLDGFKSINDSLGHDIGDQVLKLVTSRLQTLMVKGRTLFRLGGDEFTIIMDNINHKEKIDAFSKEVLRLLKEPVLFDDYRLDISGSIGISIYPNDGNNTKDLLKNADTAMYKAKDIGGNSFIYYTEDMSKDAHNYIKMKANLHEAIYNNEFKVYYQPQIRTKTEKLVGIEALVRWDHPIHGLTTPDSFISLARDSGLMIDIDWWVMLTAMQDFTNWRRKGLYIDTLSLNLTLKQLEEDNFFEQLEKYMNRTNFKPQWLELELEESDVMKNPSDIIEKFTKLHAMGIKISIDDFGTGYSSLAYLKRLPIDKLKIDKSFVFDIPNSSDSISITDAIMSMAKSLNLSVIAEGVENKEQKDYFENSYCDTIQGYFYSKPIPQEDIFNKYMH